MAQVKGNQPRLYKAIQDNILQQLPLEVYEHEERNRGKDINWSVHLYEAHLGKWHKDWPGVKRIIQIHKTVEHKSKVTHSDRYYISDLNQTSALKYHDGIRKHWGIENRLHWVKDVVHKEDQNRIRKGNGPINMSIMSTIAINIHRKHGNDSITNGQIKCGCNLKWTLGLVRT